MPDKTERSHPVDKGWAWFVLLGAVLEMLLVMGIMKAGGILFVAYQENFRSGSAMTSLISTVKHGVYSIATPIVMTVGVKLISCRTLVCAGSLVMSTSYVISALVGDIRWVIVSNGALQGIGWACVGPTTLSVIGQYFSRRRGLANSVAVGGASAGGLILAPALTQLLLEFGYRGCMLLLGALHLNLLITAALFRPVEFYKRTDRQCKYGPIKETEDKEVEEKAPDLANSIEMTDIKTKPECNARSEHLETSLKESGIKQGHNKTINKQPTPRATVEAFKTLVKYFDFGLFRNPLFVLLQISFGLVATGCRLTIIYIVTHAKDRQFDGQSLSILLVVFSTVDMVGRVVIGVIADLRFVRASVIVCVCSVVVGVSSLFVQFYTSYALLLGYALILGVVSGAPPALLGVLIVDYLSVENLSSTLGFTTLSLGLINAAGLYVSGLLRDAYGSYTETFYLIGGMTLVGAAIMATLPLVEKRQARQRFDQDEEHRH